MSNNRHYSHDTYVWVQDMSTSWARELKAPVPGLAQVLNFWLSHYDYADSNGGMVANFSRLDQAQEESIGMTASVLTEAFPEKQFSEDRIRAFSDTARWTALKVREMAQQTTITEVSHE